MNDDDLRIVKLHLRIGCRDFNEINIIYHMFNNSLQIKNEFGREWKFFDRVSLSNFHKLLTYIKKDIEFAYYRNKINKIEVNSKKIDM